MKCALGGIAVIKQVTLQVPSHRASEPNGPHIQVSGGATALGHYVRLDKLPDGLMFPADLRKQVSFDPIRKRLVYSGFMCKADYDRLANLSNDLEYRRALEQLFQISTEVEVPQLRRLRLVLVAMVIFCLVLAAVVWWHLLRDTPGPPDVPEPSGVQSLFAPFDGSFAKVVDSPMHLSLPQMQRGSRTSVARCKDWMS